MKFNYLLLTGLFCRLVCYEIQLLFLLTGLFCRPVCYEIQLYFFYLFLSLALWHKAKCTANPAVYPFSCFAWACRPTFWSILTACATSPNLQPRLVFGEEETQPIWHPEMSVSNTCNASREAHKKCCRDKKEHTVDCAEVFWSVLVLVLVSQTNITTICNVSDSTTFRLFRGFLPVCWHRQVGPYVETSVIHTAALYAFCNRPKKKEYFSLYIYPKLQRRSHRRSAVIFQTRPFM
jgi:hypothetical protein